MTDKMKKTAEDMSITLTKISISLLFIASIILIALGPWVVNLVIEFPSPFFQGETRFWVLLLLGYVLGCLALACIVHLYRLLSRIGKNQVFITQMFSPIKREIRATCPLPSQDSACTEHFV